MSTSDLKEFVKAIKSTVSVSRVLEAERHHGTMRCPIPGHDDQDPSFSWDDRRRQFKCFGCGRHGDVIDLVQVLGRAHSFVDALDVLADMAGTPRYAWKEMSDEERRTLEEARAVEARRQRARTTATQVYHQQLGQSQEAMAYIEGRSITVAVAETWQLGWAPRLGGADLLLQHGITEPDAIEAGLIRHNDGLLVPWCEGRIVIPFIDNGSTVYMTGRAIDDGVKPKYYHIGGPVPIFNADAAYMDGQLVVVEGPFDVIRLRDLGVNAVAICGTEHHRDA